MSGGTLRGRIRTPAVPQMHATECGPACLRIVLAHHGRWVPIEELRSACNVGRDGSSAADLVAAGRQYDLDVSGWRMETEALDSVAAPVILFWEFNHFVVLEGFRRGRYYINDPANGRRRVSAESFGRAFTGVVLRPAPAEGFRRSRRPPGIGRKLWPWLRQARGALVYAAAAGVLLAVLQAVLPVLLGIFVDDVLGGRQPAWGAPLIWAFAVSAVLVYLLTWLQQFTFRKVTVQLAVVHSQSFLGRLFRLPSQYFDHRYAGDISARAQLVDDIAADASTGVVWIMIELFTSLVLLAVMFAYDATLAAVVAGLGAGNIVLMRGLTRLRTDTERQYRHEQASMLGIEAAGLRDMDAMRAAAGEDDFFVRWSGHQARELASLQRFAELGQVIASLPGVFMLLGAITVLGLGGLRVMSGDMTLGALIGFYALSAGFLAPVGRFVQFADAFQVLDADLQRVQDVLDAPEDPEAEPSGAPPPAVATLRGRLRLAGHVELRDVTFGYKRDRPPLIEDLSLVIAPGQRVALVGATGSGKSTLLRLIGGEFSPWSGEILLDGVPRHGVPREILGASMAAVDQEIRLFAASVRDNLTMWSPTVGDDRLIAAAHDAQIHDEIMSRGAAYDSMVEEGGRNFSGGQRQRLEIARALAQDPAVLLLDEATSTLDALTERQIDDALRRRGLTCVIVAHRLSTIRDCDEIVVLERGRQVQRGTHTELVADRSGLYRQLVEAQ